MVIDGKSRKEVLKVSVSGRIDGNAAPELESYLDNNLSGIKKIEFDFNNVEYISSAGLRVLLKAQKKVASDEGHVLIKHMNDSVKAIFDLTGFSDLFVIK